MASRMAGQPILVLGSTGRVGRRVVAALRSAGATVRAASRAGPVRFDWAEPETWRPALAGAGAVFLMAPDGVEVAPGFVEEAAALGVPRVVLLSSDSIEAMGDERLLSAERLVRASGVPSWTILRPRWFNQNFDEGFFRPAVLAGRVTLPVGDTRQGFVDASDIAAVAAKALTTDGHEGRTYTLTGPDSLSFAEAVATIAQSSGRRVEFAGDAETYAEEQAALGRPPSEVDAEIAAFAALADLGDAVPTDDITHVTGRPARTFTAYAEAAAAAGAWKEPPTTA